MIIYQQRWYPTTEKQNYNITNIIDKKFRDVS